MTNKIPYLTNFNYYPNEIEIILENTITTIVNNAHLLAFSHTSLCEVDYDSFFAFTNSFTFELVLNDNIGFYDKNAGLRDIRRLNNHFRHLQSRCFQERDKLYNRYLCNAQQYQYTQNAIGNNNVNLTQSWIEYNEYCKKWQYFLFSNIVFISCSKADYDRNGRICIVRFRIDI